jgi:8-amino-7-oxononanoate synthase
VFMNVEKWMLAVLEARKKEEALRVLRPRFQGIDFSSNDYLSLARDGVLASYLPQFLLGVNESEQLLGSGGSRLLAGHSEYAAQTETELAQYFQSTTALLFNSGYTANLGFFSAIPQRTDTILYDAFIHASIRDGIRLSAARSWSFPHNDLAALEALLRKASGRIYVAVESIYSMDGDAAPLVDLVALCERYGAHVVVDEAHGVGVFGADGAGCVVAAKLTERIFARLVTFGKAGACHGAAWLGSAALRDYLINFSRPFIYTTALPIHDLAVIRSSCAAMRDGGERRRQLFQNIASFKQLALECGVEVIPSESPIQCVLISGNAAVRAVARRGQEAGMDLRAILAPTVAAGGERIRVCLHASNSKDEIEKIFDVLP